MIGGSVGSPRASMPEPRHKLLRKNLSTSPEPAGQYALNNKGADMAGKDGDKTLRRIVLMLLSLSLLAERASCAPWPIRCLVLLFLRRGEVAARLFALETAQAPFPIVDLSAFPADNSPAGALRLAMCFRALAAALRRLLCQPPRFAGDVRQAHGAGDVRLVLRRLDERSPVGLPGSRAPPSHFREGWQVRLWSLNGCPERLGAPCFAARG